MGVLKSQLGTRISRKNLFFSEILIGIHSPAILREMVLSASPCSLARSSLEEMLDSLRRRDEEEETKKDSPPALPARPASKARLPPARRSLPNNFKVGGGDRGVVENGFAVSNVEIKRKETGVVDKRSGSSFGSKRVKKDVESPYVVALSESTGLSGMSLELEGDSVSHFIKTVTVNLN